MGILVVSTAVGPIGQGHGGRTEVAFTPLCVAWWTGDHLMTLAPEGTAVTGCPPYPVDVFKDGTSGSNAITFLKGYHATGKVWISITRQRSGKFPNALRRLAIDDKLSMLSSASSRFFRPVKLFYHIAQMAILTFINSLKSWQKQREIFRFSSVTIPIILGIIAT